MTLTDMEHCHLQGWTDGLPVVPPTPESVTEMLGSLPPDLELGAVPPGMGVATAQNVAANAVMAGCRPLMFGVVVAAVRALCIPRLGLHAAITSVHSMVPLVLVNGPVAHEVGMEGGFGALAAGNRANMSIGRAVQLVIRNVGRAAPGGLAPKTIGHPGSISYCFTENTELSPWSPHHVSRGLEPLVSAVTLYCADAPLCLADMGRTDPELVFATVAEAASNPGTYNAYFRQELWFVVSPEHARIAADAGWSKSDLQAFLHERVALPRNRIEGRGLYGFNDELVPPTWLDGIRPDELVRFTRSPDDVVITVAGGGYGGYTSVIHGVGRSVTEAVSS